MDNGHFKEKTLVIRKLQLNFMRYLFLINNFHICKPNINSFQIF